MHVCGSGQLYACQFSRKATSDMYAMAHVLTVVFACTKQGCLAHFLFCVSAFICSGGYLPSEYVFRGAKKVSAVCSTNVSCQLVM